LTEVLAGGKRLMTVRVSIDTPNQQHINLKRSVVIPGQLADRLIQELGDGLPPVPKSVETMDPESD
jgi:hypothetical protein